MTRSAASLDPRQVLARVRAHVSETSAPAPAVERGSSLAGDDAALGPLHLSHAAWFAWTIVVDQLEAVRALVEDLGRTQPWAHHTLLRSALENAATALWLLAPAGRDERVRRRLKLAGQDVYESERAQQLSGVTPAPPGRLPAERREEIIRLARARGLDASDVLGRFGYRTVIREAAGDTTVPSDVLELIWMTGSGIAHGRTWSTFAFLEHADYSRGSDLVRQVKVTASVDQIVLVMATVLVVAERARSLYEIRRVRHH